MVCMVLYAWSCFSYIGWLQKCALLSSRWWTRIVAQISLGNMTQWGRSLHQQEMQPRLRARQGWRPLLQLSLPSFFHIGRARIQRKVKIPVLISPAFPQLGMEYDPMMANKHTGKWWERPFTRDFPLWRVEGTRVSLSLMQLPTRILWILSFCLTWKTIL